MALSFNPMRIQGFNPARLSRLAGPLPHAARQVGETTQLVHHEPVLEAAVLQFDNPWSITGGVEGGLHRQVVADFRVSAGLSRSTSLPIRSQVEAVDARRLLENPRSFRMRRRSERDVSTRP
ncbi:MAG TPA: hypothetical protein VN442_19770 [Bryobacteraceae bacterium]|nr:hypothetical protein [Bryobacteraceae bacterium]